MFAQLEITESNPQPLFTPNTMSNAMNTCMHVCTRTVNYNRSSSDEQKKPLTLQVSMK